MGHKKPLMDGDCDTPIFEGILSDVIKRGLEMDSDDYELHIIYDAGVMKKEDMKAAAMHSDYPK